MPFTPFHLGPAILLGLLLLKYIDFPTFIAANLIVDWRAALVFFGLWPGPRHAWVHSYIGSALFAVILGAVMVYLRPLIDDLLKEVKIEQSFSSRKIFFSAFSGVFLHVTLDAFHHPTMEPFLPFSFNPLLGLLSTVEVRTVALLCLIISIPVYIAVVWKNTDS